jgi:hypothetical protein
MVGMADSSTDTGSMFIILFILVLLFSLVSVGVINRNATTISIDAYAKKSGKPGESGGGGSGHITRDHAGGSDKSGSDKSGSSNDVRTASDSIDKGGGSGDRGSDSKSSNNLNNEGNSGSKNSDQSTNDGSNAGTDADLRPVEPSKTCEQASTCTHPQDSSNRDPSPNTKDKTPFVLSLPFP